MKSNKPSAIENLARLEQVISGLRSFSERERGIERARAIRNSNLRQSRAGQEKLLRGEHDAAVARKQQEAADRIQSCRDLVSARKLRIDRAQIVVRNQVVAAIQAREGQQKAQVQRRFMEAGKRHETAVAEALTRFEEESAKVKEWSKAGVALEKRAIRSVRGFSAARRQLLEAVRVGSGESVGDIPAEQLIHLGDTIRDEVAAFQARGLVRCCNAIPPVLSVFFLFFVAAGLPYLSAELGGPQISYALTLSLAGGLSVLLMVLHFRAAAQALTFAKAVAEPLARWKGGRLRYKEWLSRQFEEANRAADSEFAQEKAAFSAGLVSPGGAVQGLLRYADPADVEARASRLKERLRENGEKRADAIQIELAAELKRESGDLRQRLGALTGEQSEEEMAADLTRQSESLVAQWEEAVPPVHRSLQEDRATLPAENPLVGDAGAWTPPAELEGSLRFGQLAFKADPETLPLPQSPRMQLPGEVNYSIPLRLRIPDAASLFLETGKSGREQAIRFLNALTLGWLASAPPGRLSFSFFDPVGLGESFAGLMHLVDYEEILINSRIRTQEAQIEARLGELCEHMEKVIQMYLRNDYGTITEYNEAAGTIAERYHFVVVADFPKGFSDLAMQRLQSIATSGARCGVFLLLHVDIRAGLPRSFSVKDLQGEAAVLSYREAGAEGEGCFEWKGFSTEGASLTLAEAPDGPGFAKWIHRIGAANRDSIRIEVPFSFIAPKEGEHWTGETTQELTVPIGRSGATKLQRFALGKGTCQHALIAGKTGSGKSTLFHILVTNLALWCDPDEVEFYLIDFKKGVEFKCYADRCLPHARVVAIESDREFGLSVLQCLDQKLRERGELFRAAGVQDVSGFRALERAEPLPRTLLLIDEFQEFFIEDDAISQQAAVLLDRIVRQGRAFGIHAVLGSQTLGGAFTLARATLGQMTVRIALACNEADAYLIMDDSNPAPRLLTRPGEGIYNDRAGAVEANSPFQAVWMGEEERNRRLDEISALAVARGKSGGDLIVFEGNAPGDVTRDGTIAKVLRSGFAGPPRFFLGAPNAIKESTGVSFPRQSGANLLFVGPREDIIEAVVPIALVLLRRQLGAKARLILFDPRLSDGGPYAARVAAVAGVETPGTADIEGVLGELCGTMKSRSGNGDARTGDPVFLFVPSLQRHKQLRYVEDFSFSLDADEGVTAATLFQDLICEGAGWGIHLVTSLDSLNSVNRCLGRKAAGEFENKVLFQMSATDSASLIDSGAASGLGLGRAVFYNEAEGIAEIFRPYAEAPQEWFTNISGA